MIKKSGKLILTMFNIGKLGNFPGTIASAITSFLYIFLFYLKEGLPYILFFYDHLLSIRSLHQASVCSNIHFSSIFSSTMQSEIISTIDELNQYQLGHVTKSSLIQTLDELKRTLQTEYDN